jgi:hypothetical protein
MDCLCWPGRDGVEPAAHGQPHPFLVGTIRLELAVQHVLGDGAALTTVLGQATPPWPGTQRLLSHEAFDAVQSALLSQCQDVVPEASGAVCAVADHKALAYLAGQDLVDLTASTSGPVQPRIEAASRDTERLAHHHDRPGPSVFRHEAELHIDSFAK